MDRSHQAAPFWARDLVANLAQLAVLETVVLGVRVSPRLPIRTYSPMAETVASKPIQWRFKSSYVHHVLVAQLAEATALNPVQCRIVACLGHQIHAPLAQWESRRFTPGQDRVRFVDGVPFMAPSSSG